MSRPSTTVEERMAVLRPLPSLALRAPPFTSTRRKVGRLLPSWGALRSHLPSAVHSLIEVTAQSMGVEPSNLVWAATGQVIPRQVTTMHRAAARSLVILALLIAS